VLQQRQQNCSIDSPPSCLGLHDLRIACLNTYYFMKDISLLLNILDQLSDKVMVKAICIAMIVNTKDDPTKLVRQDAIYYLLCNDTRTPKLFLVP